MLIHFFELVIFIKLASVLVTDELDISNSKKLFDGRSFLKL